MAKRVLTDKLSEPLSGITAARIDINAGDGNLIVDRLTDSAQLLASGTLQYLENQGVPTKSVDTSNGQITLRLRTGRAEQPWFRLPWAACNGATEWQIHLNPAVSSDITAHTDGGNVKLNLEGMAITHVSADTGGGNMDVILPDNATNSMLRPAPARATSPLIWDTAPQVATPSTPRAVRVMWLCSSRVESRLAFTQQPGWVR